MRKFIFFILEIIVITFITAIIIQRISDYGLRNLKNSIYNDWDNIIEGKINADVLIMGSSRGFVSYSSKIISDEIKLKTFNLSYNAGAYNLQHDKLKIYLKKNKKPKVIIQNIDISHFGKNDVLPQENQFTPFINNCLIRDFIIQYDKKFNYIEYIPLLKYNQDLKLLKWGILSNFKKYSIENKTYAGYSPQNYPFRIDYNNLKNLETKDVDRVEYTRKFYEIIKFYSVTFDDSTKIILVWAPENKLRLHEIYSPTRNFLITKIKSLEKKYKNIYFIDMSNDEISQTNNYFYDTFHLNQRGSEVFSRKISAKIIKILN